MIFYHGKKQKLLENSCNEPQIFTHGENSHFLMEILNANFEASSSSKIFFHSIIAFYGTVFQLFDDACHVPNQKFRNFFFFFF